MDIGEIIAIIVAIGALIGNVIMWRKLPHETKEIDARAESQDADTASKYQAIADKAAERALRLEERMEAKVLKLECRVDELESEVAKLTEEINWQRTENSNLRDWAERLVHQVQSLGGEPVKLRVKTEKQK